MTTRFDSTSRFSSRVDNYVRYRPGYPQGVMDLFREQCSLNSDSPIADIGSGTGKLAELLLGNGNPVWGVEPNREMREAGERLLMHFPRFHSLEGTAEATNLPDRAFELIAVGQAFHWFDLEACRSEFLRILKPGGFVSILWNDRLVDASPFLAAYEKLLRNFSPDYEQVNHRRFNDGQAVRRFLDRSCELKHFPNAQYFDFDGLKGRLLSSSYAPEAGQPNHLEMLGELEQIFETHQSHGRVVFEYETHVYYGRMNQG